MCKLYNRRHKRKGRSAGIKIYEAPAAVVSVVTRSGDSGQFSAPIDEESDEEIQAVHAVSGGVVTYAGINRDLGVCTRISHEVRFQCTEISTPLQQ